MTTRLYFTKQKVCIGSYSEAARSKEAWASDDFLLPDGYTIADAIGKTEEVIRKEIAALRTKNFLAKRNFKQA